MMRRKHKPAVTFVTGITLLCSSVSAFSQTSNVSSAMPLPLNNAALSPQMASLMFPSLGKKDTIPAFTSRDQRDAELSVLTRKAREYNPQNIMLGLYTLAPSVEVGADYTDNVYASSVRQREDWVRTLRAEMIARSDFDVHALNLDAYVEDGSYQKLSEEDYRDYGVKMDGRYDFRQGISIPLALGYETGHSRRDNPEERRFIDPTVYHQFGATTGFKLSGNRLDINGRTGFQDITYDDTTSFAGFTVDNSDRNHTVLSNYLSVGAPEEAMIAPLAYLAHRETSYEISRDNFGIERDSTDFELGVGSEFNFSPLVRSGFRIGRVHRDFNDPSLDDPSALTYSLNLNWDVTTLAALSLTGGRQMRETSANAAAQLESTALLSLVYELEPNILLKPSVGWVEKEYIGTDAKSTGITGGMEVQYKITPNVWATTKYENVTQDESGSNVVGDEGFDENRVSFALKFQI